jgi:uncharacterized protein YcnI
MPTSAPARRLLAGTIVGAALVLAAPLAASAHVHVSPEDAPAGASTRLDFSFSHGCDGAPTTALVVMIPDGVDGVTPVLDGAWGIQREVGDDGIPTAVTYTAAAPVDDGVAASVSMDVIFASSAADSAVAFPVLQQCTVGETDWSEIAEDGADAHELEAPAPVVAVGEAAETDEAHDHGDAGTAAHADAGAADPLARWLSGGALVAALAALVVALLPRRHRA